MEQDKNRRKSEPVFSLRLRAGRRRTYFFDVRPTRSEDFYLTITESKKKFDSDGYDRHKIFLYKEDFNKFIDALEKSVNHIKTELLPDYDFDEFTREITDDQIETKPLPSEQDSEDEKRDKDTSADDDGDDYHLVDEDQDDDESDGQDSEESDEEDADESDDDEDSDEDKDDDDDEEAMKW